jgi:hypothetical protein
MGLIRVWNITDDANNPKVTPHNRMVLGKVIKPGRSVKVDEARLKLAHKVKKEVASKFLHIGDQLPPGYMHQKRPPRAVADSRLVDDKGRLHGAKKDVAPGHGQVPAELIAKESGAAISKAAGEPPAEEKAEEPVEEKAEETSDEEESDSYSFGGRRKKNKRG